MANETGWENTYQWMLRALGAFLDEESSCRITVMEVADGFLVRVHRSMHRLEPQVLHFSRAALAEHLADLARQHKTTLGRVRHQGIWSHVPNGHQDFFRALGFELDEASAHAVLIEELDDGLALTYSYPERDTGVWRKRVLLLKLPEIEEILNAAFERRKQASAITQP